MCGSAEVDLNDYFAFLDGIHEAPFLFGEEISEYLKEVQKKVILLRKTQKQLESRSNLADEDREKMIEKESDLVEWLSNTLVEGQKVF